MRVGGKDWWHEVVTFKRLMIFNLLTAPFVGAGRAIAERLLS